MKIKLQDLTVFSLFGYALFAVFSITIAEIFFTLGLLFWAADTIKNKKAVKDTFSSPITLPLVVFVCAHFISALFGIDRASGLANFSKTYIILIVFLVMNNARREGDLKLYAGLFSAGASVIGLYAVITTVYFRYIKHDMLFRAHSFSGNHMHAGGLLMMAVVVTAGILVYLIKNKPEERAPLYLYACAFMLSAAGLLFTFTRGSWLGAAAGVFILLLFTDKKIFTGLAIAALLILFLGRDTSYAARLMDSFRVHPGTSQMERVLMWKSGLKIFRDHPVTGIGTGNLDKIYPQYRDPGAVEANEGHLHNNVIQIAVIDGLVGLGAFLWLFIALWVALIKAWKKEADPARKTLFAAAFSVGIAFFVNGFFEYNFFSSQVALAFWFLMGTAFGAMRGAGVQGAGVQGTGSKVQV